MLKKTPKMAHIELIHYLRDITAFESKEALIKAIKGDIEVAESLLKA
jgi:FAD synthase